MRVQTLALAQIVICNELNLAKDLLNQTGSTRSNQIRPFLIEQIFLPYAMAACQPVSLSACQPVRLVHQTRRGRLWTKSKLSLWRRYGECLDRWCHECAISLDLEAATQLRGWDSFCLPLFCFTCTVYHDLPGVVKAWWTPFDTESRV